MIPFLPTRTELAIRYKLNSDGLAVLSAVIFYCREAPHIWELNAHQMVRDIPYLKNHVKVGRYLKQLLQVGALKANGKIITLSDKLLLERNVPKLERNVPELEQNVPKLEQNVPHIINNNINNNRERKEPNGGRSRAEIEKEDDFIVPSWSEVMDYARGRTNWRGSTQEMREEAADDYFAKMSECGWRVDGAPVVKWQAGVYRFYKQARKRYEREAGVRAATMFQAGYRPENRSYEHKVAMSERAREEKAIEAAKAEAESQSDEERQATFDTIERLQAHFAASENSKNRRANRSP